jgi:hypothetical protein
VPSGVITGLTSTVRGTGEYQRVTRMALARAKDHELQVHPDLRRRQPSALCGLHRIQHVRHQAMQGVGVEFGHRLGHAQQPRVSRSGLARRTWRGRCWA